MSPTTSFASRQQARRHLANSGCLFVTRCAHRFPHHITVSVFPMCTLPELFSAPTNLTGPTPATCITRPCIRFPDPVRRLALDAAVLDTFSQRFFKGRQLRLVPAIQTLVDTVTHFELYALGNPHCHVGYRRHWQSRTLQHSPRAPTAESMDVFGPQLDACHIHCLCPRYPAHGPSNIQSAQYGQHLEHQCG